MRNVKSVGMHIFFVICVLLMAYPVFMDVIHNKVTIQEIAGFIGLVLLFAMLYVSGIKVRKLEKENQELIKQLENQ
ncbi:MAG: hypothetical protein J6M18_01950 [Actinomycetaceae bacterium]|nr:hypothetical protein [Actinomycetaceae bacterium]